MLILWSSKFCKFNSGNFWWIWRDVKTMQHRLLSASCGTMKAFLCIQSTAQITPGTTETLQSFTNYDNLLHSYANVKQFYLKGQFFSFFVVSLTYITGFLNCFLWLNSNIEKRKHIISFIDPGLRSLLCIPFSQKLC